MRVIVNASPLIVLFKSRLGALLPQLCDEVIVPAAVWDAALRAVMDAGLRLSDGVVDLLKKQAGE